MIYPLAAPPPGILLDASLFIEEFSMQKHNQNTDRRSFMKIGAAASVATLGAGLLGSSTNAAASTIGENAKDVAPTAGDIAILQFLAAAELVEQDLWIQYADLAAHNPQYREVLSNIDADGPTYAAQTASDEGSHANFINAYLKSVKAEPVNLDAFRTIASPSVTGANPKGNLTNLTELTVDTSWYNRYRSEANIDLGATFPQLVDLDKIPTVPTSNSMSDAEAQAIANSAFFHFCAIEQGGSSLYSSLMTQVTSLEVLDILASIGPTEFYHFAIFQKSLEGLPPVEFGKLNFPDLKGDPAYKVSQVMPLHCQFIKKCFPQCSIVRPRALANAGPLAAATGLVKSGLFTGQSTSFFDAVVALATAANNAERTVSLAL
jgi:hypothetical protein